VVDTSTRRLVGVSGAGKAERELADLLNITSGHPTTSLDKLKLHRSIRPNGAIALPRKRCEVKKNLIT